MSNIDPISELFENIYGNKKPEAIDINSTTQLNKHYVECVLLNNGKVLELSGSHQMTAAKYFGINLQEISIKEYEKYFERNYGIIYIHSRYVLSNYENISNFQKRTINRMIKRGGLDKNILSRKKPGSREEGKGVI